MYFKSTLLKCLAQVTQYYMAARQIQFPSFDETEFDSKRFSKHMLYVIFSLRKKEKKIRFSYVIKVSSSELICRIIN